MKNKLIVKGKQEFLGKEIPIIEGGFGENKKVILAKTVAEIHETELKRINELIRMRDILLNDIEKITEDIEKLESKNN